MSKPSPPPSSQGLAGIVAGQSAISTVGLGNGLNYRGYNIQDLAQHCIFQEVVHLLLYGQLPSRVEASQLVRRMAGMRTLPQKLKNILETIPKHANAMDVMRTIVSVMGLLQPETTTNQQHDIALRLIALLGPALLYWRHYSIKGIRIDTSTDLTDTVAVNFLKLYHQTATVDALQAKTMDVSLILYAQHDFNASTFVARCTVSTMSDFYSGITSAVGALRGPLHGGANQAAMYLLEGLKSVEEADKMLNEKWAKKQLVMGFGHRIYKKQDPRSDIIKTYSQKLAQQPFGKPLLVRVSERIEEKMIKEKKIYPNLDFYAASAYHQCGIDTQGWDWRLLVFMHFDQPFCPTIYPTLNLQIAIYTNIRNIAHIRVVSSHYRAETIKEDYQTPLKIHWPIEKIMEGKTLNQWAKSDLKRQSINLDILIKSSEYY